MNDKDQFDWMAHEAYPAPEFTDTERKKLSDLLERAAGELGLSPQQFWAGIQRTIDEKIAPESKETDPADWWKKEDPQ